MNPKIIRGKTDSGGVLTKVFYLDDKHNFTSEDDATNIIKEEYDKDGTMIMRIYLTPAKNSRSYHDILTNIIDHSVNAKRNSIGQIDDQAQGAVNALTRYAKTIENAGSTDSNNKR